MRRLVLCSLLLLVGGLSHGSSESARYLRNAVHFYEVGRYQKSKDYLVPLLWVGTPPNVESPSAI